MEKTLFEGSSFSESVQQEFYLLAKKNAFEYARIRKEYEASQRDPSAFSKVADLAASTMNSLVFLGGGAVMSGIAQTGYLAMAQHPSQLGNTAITALFMGSALLAGNAARTYMKQSSKEDLEARMAYAETVIRERAVKDPMGIYKDETGALGSAGAVLDDAVNYLKATLKALTSRSEMNSIDRNGFAQWKEKKRPRPKI